MKPLYATAGIAALLLSGVARADVCFTVLDSGGRVLHQSRKAPVDMSRPISDTLYSRFPRAAVMVFGTNNESCEEIQVVAPAAPQVERRGRRM